MDDKQSSIVNSDNPSLNGSDPQQQSQSEQPQVANQAQAPSQAAEQEEAQVSPTQASGADGVDNAQAEQAQVPAEDSQPTKRQLPIDPKDAHILLAEDEEDARTIYKDVLDDEFKISTSKNGRDTLAKLAEEPFDVLLLDIIMPDMDGISVLTELKKYPAKYGDPIVVMLTNIGGDLAIEKALAIGANGYLLKSEAEPSELIKAIKKYLQGEEHVKLEKYLTDE